MCNTVNTQLAWGHDGENYMTVEVPSPYTEVMPGVRWGCVEDMFTPAFWKYQSQMKRICGYYQNHRLGRSLMEEVSACLLGGYGMPAELGLAAFERLRNLDLLCGTATNSQIEQPLSIPFVISEKPRKYRFVRQKAQYLSLALKALREASVPDDERELRDYLTTLKGIGLKTASWVVRNHLGSNSVAILDIHIVRAGIAAGIFDQSANPVIHYIDLEQRFLTFCDALNEPASVLDAIMWDYMRRIGPTMNNKDRTIYRNAGYRPKMPRPSAM